MSIKHTREHVGSLWHATNNLRPTFVCQSSNMRPQIEHNMIERPDHHCGDVLVRLYLPGANDLELLKRGETTPTAGSYVLQNPATVDSFTVEWRNSIRSNLSSCSWLSRPVPVRAVTRPRTRASRANVHKRAKPAT